MHVRQENQTSNLTLESWDRFCHKCGAVQEMEVPFLFNSCHGRWVGRIKNQRHQQLHAPRKHRYFWAWHVKLGLWLPPCLGAIIVWCSKCIPCNCFWGPVCLACTSTRRGYCEVKLWFDRLCRLEMFVIINRKNSVTKNYHAPSSSQTSSNCQKKSNQATLQHKSIKSFPDYPQV
jgi:hypothetical protein